MRRHSYRSQSPRQTPGRTFCIRSLLVSSSLSVSRFAVIIHHSLQCNLAVWLILYEKCCGLKGPVFGTVPSFNICHDSILLPSTHSLPPSTILDLTLILCCSPSTLHHACHMDNTTHTPAHTHITYIHMRPPSVIKHEAIGGEHDRPGHRDREHCQGEDGEERV